MRGQDKRASIYYVTDKGEGGRLLFYARLPGGGSNSWTVRVDILLDIRLDIQKITYIFIELSVQQWTSTENFSHGYA